MAEETTTTEETPKEDPLDIVEPKELDFGADDEPTDESPKAEGDDEPVDEPEDDEDSLDDSDEEDEPEEDAEEFDSDVLDRARELGLGDDAARTLGQATVSALLANMDRQLATVASKIEAPPKPEEPESQRHEWKLDPDVWDKEFTDELQRYTDSRDSAIDTLSKKVGLLEDELTKRVQADDEHRFRSMVTGLGDDYKELLGDGVKLTPAQSKRNNAIREQMTVLAKGREAAGLKTLPEATLFEQATRSVLGDETKQLALQKKSNRVRNRQGQFSSPPTHQKSKGDAKSTVQVVGEFMRNKGMLEDQDEFSDDF